MAYFTQGIYFVPFFKSVLSIKVCPIELLGTKTQNDEFLCCACTNNTFETGQKTLSFWPCNLLLISCFRVMGFLYIPSQSCL